MTFTRDLLERVLRTFIAGLLTAVVAGMSSVTDMTTAKALAMSAVLAGITACIGVVGRFVGDPSTASFITPETDQ